MVKDYTKMACNTFTFYFLFKIYIFTKNGQISLKYFSASLRFSGLLRLAETRLAETTIGRRPIGRKPQLADVTISRNHDWPKAQIGRKRAG
jgi:hypothetical protein